MILYLSIDTTMPVVLCPDNMTVEYDYGSTTAMVEFSELSVMDNSGEILDGSCDPPSNSTFTSGNNVVMCSATDAAGNTGNCYFTITVEGKFCCSGYKNANLWRLRHFCRRKYLFLLQI